MWTAGTWAALLLSGLIGLSLGMAGGGGSIVTVPLLIYVAALPVPQAVALSLAIVGATAAIGGALHARSGTADAKTAFVFGTTGMVGAAGGARLTPLVPPPVLLALLAALMLFVGARMLRGRSEAEEPQRAECAVWKCALAGLGLGALTGFLGVGGGFLIVPALLRFARMPMKQAVGTSLLIIAANSASGFLAHRSALGRRLDLALAFTAAAVVGMLGGLALARRMQPSGLKTTFGVVSIALAAYLLARNAVPLLDLIRP